MSTSTTTTAYVADILEQPDCLRALLRSHAWDAIAPLGKQAKEYDRIVLTGMGASLFALWPAWLTLTPRNA